MKKIISLYILSLIFIGACDNKTTSPSTPNSSSSTTPIVGEKVDYLKVKSIVNQRCTVCHSANAKDPSFGSPAGGTLFDTDEQIKAKSDRIKARAVVQKTMPFANNKTGITDDERALLGKWVDQGASIN